MTINLNNVPEPDRSLIECSFKFRDGSKCRKLGIFEHDREKTGQPPALFCSAHSNQMTSVFPEREQVEYPNANKTGTTIKKPVQQSELSFNFDDLME